MNLQKLKDYKFAAVEQTLTFRDSIIYALGLGYGFDPNLIGRNCNSFMRMA